MRTLILISLFYVIMASPVFPAQVLSDGEVINILGYTTPWYFKYNQGDYFWAVVGVRPMSGDDWDIQLYTETSFSNLVASSEWSGDAVDYVVTDYNHSPTGWEGIKIKKYSGSVGCYVEYENGSEYLDPPGRFGAYNWDSYHVVKIWDVYLEAGETFTFTLDITNGTIDLGVALFKSENSAYYATRSAQIRKSDVNGISGDETFTYTVQSTDWYGLVVWCNNTASGEYFLDINCETPGAPVPLVPHNTTACVNPSVPIDWTDVGDATEYHLQVDDNSDFSSPVIDVYTSTSHYYASGLDPWKTYYWRVAGCNDDCGCGYWCSTRNFYAVDVPGAPVPLVPHNTTVCVNPSVPIDWSDVGDATEYHLQVDDNSDFSSPVIDVYTSTSHYYASGLDPWKTYYWRVAGCNDDCGCGYWCSTRNFYAVDVPGTPGTPSASPNPVCVNSQYCLTWGSVSGATSYEVCVGSSCQNVGNTTSWCTSKPSPGEYCYTVKAKNQCGTSGNSPQRCVTVNGPPPPPPQPTASPNPVCVDNEFCVSWSPVSGATFYEIRENGGSWDNVGNVSQKCYTKNVIGDYTYDVRACNDCGCSGDSPDRTVTVISAPPAPLYVSPDSEARKQSQPVHLDWSDVSGADKYQIQVDTNPDFSLPVIDAQPSYYNASGLAQGTRYYWRVRAHNDCGWGDWSSPYRNFCTPGFEIKGWAKHYCDPTLDDATPINGLYVCLVNTLTDSIDTVTTNAAGVYSFEDVLAGSYRIFVRNWPSVPLYENLDVKENEKGFNIVQGCMDDQPRPAPGDYNDAENPSERELPGSFFLSQNRPNPFNPITEIRFSLPRGSHAKLEIYNVMGQRITTLADKYLSPGEYSCTWDGSDVASGVYFYRLEAGEFVESRKMVLLK